MTKYIRSIRKHIIHINTSSSVRVERVVTETEYYNANGYATICEYTGIIDNCPMYANNFGNFLTALFELFACQITYTPVEKECWPKTKKYNVKLTFEDGDVQFVDDEPIETIDEFSACDLFALRHAMLPIISDEYPTVEKALNHISDDIMAYMIRAHRIPCRCMARDYILKNIELVELVDEEEEE